MTLSPLRKGRITASQAGAILGVDPLKTREDVMQDWIYGSTFKGNVATEHGNFYEEYALTDLALRLNRELEQNIKFFIHPKVDWIGATPDIVQDDFICEIKCPYSMRRSENQEEFKSIKDLPHYYAQIQVQLACTGKGVCYFYQWAPTGISQMEAVKVDRHWRLENFPKLKQFIEDYKHRLQTLDEDEKIAIEFRKVEAEFNEIKNKLESIKQDLIERSNGKKRKFGNVLVYPIERKGSIAYAKVLKEKLPDLDLEPYRGEPSISWGIK
jgi:putative phage-type endonuclease